MMAPHHNFVIEEIHQILHWNEFEKNLSFMLITIKGVFKLLFFLDKIIRNKLIPMKTCFELLPLPNMVLLLCGSSLTLISFFFILDNFQNTCVTLNIHISAKRQPKIKTNISNFQLAHWQSKHISFLKNPLLMCISRLIEQEYFFGSPGRSEIFAL